MDPRQLSSSEAFNAGICGISGGKLGVNEENAAGQPIFKHILRSRRLPIF